ncbi:MAG: TonB-dependent receptor [Rhodoferax sp.]|nr:TonB-dependent receptor [Rhodoferax sp.]
MKTFSSRARLAALPLALVAAFPSLAQTQLPEMVVSATRFAEPAGTLPFGVSVITADEIRASGVTSVNEAVMKLLGVVGRLDTSGGNNYSLDLRGFGVTADSNQVVIVDGLRLNEADLTSAGLASIPIESVYRIEVLRGTGAVLYGEGATGGVIVVTTKAGNGAQRVTSAQLYGAVGTHGLRETRASAVIASGGFSADIAASSRDSDGHRQNFASASNALEASAQWSNGWLRLGARVGRDAMHSGLPGALTAAQYAADPTQANSLTEYGAVQKTNSGAFVQAQLGDWQLAVDANQRSKKYDSVAFASPYAYDVDARNYSLRARHDGKFGEFGNVFIAGYDKGRWNRTITNSAFTPIGSLATADTSAYYLKDDLTLPGTGTRFSLGARSEGITKTEAASLSALNERQHAWEAGISQPLGTAISVYGRLGQSFRLANVDEFSFTTPGVPLKAQTSRDAEVGARWKNAQSQVDVRLYRSALRNEIGFDPAGLGPFGPFGANVNFDPTKRQGLEIEGRHAISSILDVRLNAALRQAKFTSGAYAGNEVSLVPRRTLALRADWRPMPGHTLDGGINWVSSQSPDFANVCRMPSYTTADIRYAYQWGAAELALGIANLTDHKYYTQAYGCTMAGVVTSIYPEAGRVVTASLRVKF